jgi:Protein of unknown function (DUF1326)
MKLVSAGVLITGFLGLLLGANADLPEWSLNATTIEACTCPMLCQCFFNSQPATHAGHGSHGGEHYCRFNIAFKVNKGRYGAVTLEGVKFWIAGDLGADFSQGQADWAVLTFERSTPKPERDAIMAILPRIYPLKWRAFSLAEDGNLEWEAGKDRAVARLNSGTTAEVILRRHPGNTADPIVVTNLKYHGAPRNDGIVLMPSEVQFWRGAERPFESRGTTGYMVTIDINSRDSQ